MSIDEAIKHAEEVAKQREILADKWQEEGGEEWGKTIACRECAVEHRQLAEWLKELKRLREQTRWIPCFERLPEEDDLTQVLASVNERYALYKIILLPSRSVKTEYKLGHIDAWMELPKPYRKEASE